MWEGFDMDKTVVDELRRELDAWKLEYERSKDINLKLAEMDAQRAILVDSLVASSEEMDRLQGSINSLVADEDDEDVLPIVSEVVGDVLLMDLVR